MATEQEALATIKAAADGQVQNLCTITADAGEEARIAQALWDSRRELRRLSGLLVSIQEDERRRIALDLHDGLGQSLSLIKLSIEKCAGLLAAGASKEAGESLQQLIPRVQGALVEVRRVSTELRPLILDDLGILPTLSWFFREFEAVCGGIAVERTFNVAERDVPVPLHITVYRILQEAFHNIVKHSAADRVRVRLDRIDDALAAGDRGQRPRIRSGQHQVRRRPDQGAGAAQHEGARIVFRRNLPFELRPRAGHLHQGFVDRGPVPGQPRLLPRIRSRGHAAALPDGMATQFGYLKNTVHCV